MILNDKKIVMMNLNPRYTDIEEIDVKHISNNQTNKEIAMKLMKYEGDLSDLYELILSISKNGWQYINDRILLHKSYNSDVYYVLEGNRRYMSYLLLKGELILSQISNDSHLSLEKDKKNYEINYKKILSIINANIKIDLLSDYFDDISEMPNEEIWKTIYSKHIGEQVGKRDWSRAKYFNDLFNMYKNSLITNNYENVINNLSMKFGKKISVIKRDIDSSIWIIYSIKIYEKWTKKTIDLKNMKVSGFELMRNQMVWVSGKELTLNKILGIEIDNSKCIYKYDNKFSEEKYSNIISFLIEKSLEGKITTRGIDEDIYDDLSDVIGQSLYSKKNLNSVYLSLKKLNTKSEYDNKIFELLKLMKMEEFKKTQFIDNNFDSVFIKSIKYILRNDLISSSNLKMYDEGEYPFSNISSCIRTIIDMIFLEALFRSSDPKILLGYNELTYKDKDKQIINLLINKGEISEANGLKIIIDMTLVVINHIGITKFVNDIKEKIKSNFKNQLIQNNIDIDLLDALFINLIEIRRNFKSEKYRNINLLNELVHKPYIGFEIVKTDSKMIDNFNHMLRSVFNFLKISNIWNNIIS